MRTLHLIPRILLSAFSIVLLFTITLSLRAQGVADESPLGFKTIFSRVGVEGGIDMTRQEGTYAVGCGEFTEGSKTNVSIALAYDQPIAELLKVEGLFGFRQRIVSQSYVTTEPSVIRTADGFVERDIDYDNVGEARFSYFYLQPSLKFYPLNFFYIGVGLNAAVTIDALTTYSKDIVTKVVTLDDGTVLEAFYPPEDSSDPHSRVFPAVRPDETSVFLIDPVMMAGVELRLGDNAFIGPRVTYGLPVMAAVKDPELKFKSIQATLGIRYYLR